MNWFIGVFLLLLFALAFGLGLLAYSMYALLGVMLVSRWLSRVWAEKLSATRECNRVSVNIDDMVAVVVTVENQGKLPVVWVLVEDLLPRAALFFRPPKIKVLGSRLHLAMLRPFARKTMIYQVQFFQRGYYQIGPLMLETGDLFGLHRRYRVLTAPHFVLVYPKIIPLEGYDIASRRPIGEVRMTHRLYEDPTRIAGVRRYEAGDPLNRVHWRATARTGTLHSKIYEPSTIAGATLLIDFHQNAYDADSRSFRSELAVTAAASIANAVYQMGQQIGFVTNGRDAAERVRQEGWDADPRSRQAARRVAEMHDHSDRLQPIVIETGRGPDQLLRILQTLARVELTDGLTFAQMVLETTGRIHRDATVVALLPSVSTETAVALGSLRRRGMAVTAVLNMYDEDDFAAASGKLLAEGVSSHHLPDEDSVTTVCQEYVLR